MGHKPRASARRGNTKKFMFLSYGFKKPTPEQMSAWGRWFDSISGRIVDQGGFWSGGRELTKRGVKQLPFGKDSITGYLIFTAKSLDEAEKIAEKCPVVASNRIYEIMVK
jgi:hypothetical protein